MFDVAEILVETDMVVFACIANFLCDSVDGDTTNFAQDFADTISRHFTVVKEFAQKNPSRPVAIARPLCRSSPIWFLSQYQLIIDTFDSLFAQFKVSNMYSFTVPEASKLEFALDLVHLTPSCGENYVYSLIDQSWEVFDKLASTPISVTTIDSDSDVDSFHSSMEVGDSPRPVTSGPVLSQPSVVTMDLLLAEIRKNNVVATVKAHEVRINQVQARMSSGFRSTDFAITRLFEDQDFQANLSKENRVTIGSMVVNEVVPTDRDGWISLITSKVQLVIKETFKSDSVFVPKLIGVAIRSTKLNFKKEFPNFDAIFENSTHALCFRRTLGIASRQGKSAHKLFVSNCVTLATRVRIEIMLALSRHLNTLGFTCHVQSFVSRPVIHIKPRESTVSKVFTFSDCVRKYSGYFDSVDLSGAYKRAGDYFEGTLSRYFVVLPDEVSSQSQRSARAKRTLNDQNRPGKKRN